MEKLRVAKIESVLIQRSNECLKGTLHLTQHHLIFAPDSFASTSSSSASSSQNNGEIWFPYSLLWLVTRLPSILPLDNTIPTSSNRPTAKRIYPLLIRLRNFQSAALGFETESVLTDTFESIKACIIATTPEDLYAFFYEPRPPLSLAPRGWHIYDAKAEFHRQGVGKKTKAWRFCEVNTGYGFCSTYPSHLCVPTRISDTVIRHAGKYRSKERIPSLTYLHHSNLASITRSSQPLVGLNNRSMQDEKLIEAIFTSHLFADPESSTAKAALTAGMNNVVGGNAATERGNMLAIYGATTTNLIIDARPTTNAMANRAKGAGTENMEHYKGCKKVYLGIDNIHVMRDSLQRVTIALRASEPPWTFGYGRAAAAAATATARAASNGVDGEGNTKTQTAVLSDRGRPPLDLSALKRSQWLKHISALLEGTLVITKNVHVNNSHVLIHCSDGWDRTSQLSALAQICLDPYYRTMRGYAVLVEKDWCSFGHRFWDRCGHSSSEKYFETAHGYGEENSEDDSNDEGGGGAGVGGGGGGFEAQAAANAIWGFTKQLTANFQSSNEGHASQGKNGAHLKEISPVFHQFLDCTWQIMRQYPKRFEFNEKWLLDLFDNLYECKYGTFLYNCEAERNGLSAMGMKSSAASKTQSVWDYMLDQSQQSRYCNELYDSKLDSDTKRKDADLGVLMVNSKDVGFWGGVFRRNGSEMNKLVQAEAEERKRQLELAQLEQHESKESSAPVEIVDGVTTGIVVHGLEDDPVMRNGVVDLGKGGLAYQPYQSRSKASASRPNKQEVASASSFSPMSTPLDEGNSGNALDAAAKLFSGWGAKLQDAYNNVKLNNEEQLSTSSNGNSSMQKNIVKNDTLAYKPLPSLGPPSNLDALTEANPWAAPISIGQDERLMAGDFSLSLEQRRNTATSQKVREVQKSKIEETKKENVAFDPLGVANKDIMYL